MRRGHRPSHLIRGSWNVPPGTHAVCPIRPRLPLPLFLTLRRMICLTLYGTWTFRTLDCSYHGLFVPSLDDSYRDARLTKINVSYQNVPVFSVSQTPLNFSDIFPKRLGLFSLNFTFRLYIPIYAGLQVFI